MNSKIEKLTGKTLEEVDFGPYQPYVKEAVEDNGTLKIHTTQMPNVLYAMLRDYLVGFGFKRHPRGRYFFAPVTPESQQVARKLVGAMYSVAVAPAQEAPAQSDAQTDAREQATAPSPVKTKPAPKPGAKSKRASRKSKPAAPSTGENDAAGDVAFAE